MRGIWNWASVGQTLMCSGTCFGMLANILTFLVAWSQNACIYLKYVPPEVCVNFVISLLWKWYAPIPGSAVSFRQSKDILTKLGWLISWSSEAALRLPGRTNTRLLSKLMNLSNLVDHLQKARLCIFAIRPGSIESCWGILAQWLQPRNQDFGCAQCWIRPVMVNILKLRWIFPEAGFPTSNP